MSDKEVKLNIDVKKSTQEDLASVVENVVKKIEEIEIPETEIKIEINGAEIKSAKIVDHEEKDS